MALNQIWRSVGLLTTLTVSLTSTVPPPPTASLRSHLNQVRYTLPSACHDLSDQVSGIWPHAWASLAGRRLLIVRQPSVVVVGPDARRPYSARPSLIFRRSDPEGPSRFLSSVPGADQWLLAFDARVLVPLLRLRSTCPHHRRTATCSVLAARNATPEPSAPARPDRPQQPRRSGEETGRPGA
jgi:hypothetical protein